jgi:hypothetical protein
MHAAWLAWAETEKRKRLGLSIYVSVSHLSFLQRSSRSAPSICVEEGRSPYGEHQCKNNFLHGMVIRAKEKPATSVVANF